MKHRIDSLSDNFVEQNNSYYSVNGSNAEKWAQIAEQPDYRAFHALFKWNILWSRFSEQDSIRLLDVGCGRGYFPRTLSSLGYAPKDVSIETDIVDISDYSLAEYEKDLPAPFVLNRKFHCSVESLPQDLDGIYDLVWSIHSLYIVRNIQASVRNILGKLKDTGIGIVFMPSVDSDYIRIYNKYLNYKNIIGRKYNYNSVEDIITEIRNFGIRDIDCADCRFCHEIPLNDVSMFETYVNQICFSDEWKNIQEWLEAEHIGEFLINRLREDRWVFRQRVKIVCFSKSELPDDLFTESDREFS
jgi:SAM-dependent methyltransferase